MLEPNPQPEVKSQRLSSGEAISQSVFPAMERAQLAQGAPWTMWPEALFFLNWTFIGMLAKAGPVLEVIAEFVFLCQAYVSLHNAFKPIYTVEKNKVSLYFKAKCNSYHT